MVLSQPRTGIASKKAAANVQVVTFGMWGGGCGGTERGGGKRRKGTPMVGVPAAVGVRAPVWVM